MSAPDNAKPAAPNLRGFPKSPPVVPALRTPEEVAGSIWTLPGHDNTVSRAAGALAVRHCRAEIVAYLAPFVDALRDPQTGARYVSAAKFDALVSAIAKIGGAP